MLASTLGSATNRTKATAQTLDLEGSCEPHGCPVLGVLPSHGRQAQQRGPGVSAWPPLAERLAATLRPIPPGDGGQEEGE